MRRTAAAGKLDERTLHTAVAAPVRYHDTDSNERPFAGAGSECAHPSSPRRYTATWTPGPARGSAACQG